MKLEFETVEDAIAYLKNEIQPELARLKKVEDEEKPALLRKRDELLSEAKSAKARAADLEQQLAAIPKNESTEQVEERYRSLYEQDKAAFQRQLDELKAEREREKLDADRNRLKAAALGELSKPQYRLHRPDEFFRLYGSDVKLDETGTPYVDLGDYKRQPLSAFVEDLENRADMAHHFKPKGGSGSGSAGAGAPAAGGYSGKYPFKKGAGFNLTEQAKLRRSNPALAARLQAEAKA